MQTGLIGDQIFRPVVVLLEPAAEFAGRDGAVPGQLCDPQPEPWTHGDESDKGSGAKTAVGGDKSLDGRHRETSFIRDHL